MFRCQVTGKLSRRGDPRTGELYHITDTEKVRDDTRGSEKLHKIVVQTRERIYTRWVRDEDTNKWIEVECGRGWEIVKEINASDEGLALWNSWDEDERAFFLKRMN